MPMDLERCVQAAFTNVPNRQDTRDRSLELLDTWSAASANIANANDHHSHRLLHGSSGVL